MKMTFRWYGENDNIPLEYIKQIPNISGVVTAVYDSAVGEVWKEKSIEKLKNMTLNAGLEMQVIESVPVHEDIKLGKPTRDKYIENYAKNIELLSKFGVKCVCYNFMPVFDWTRTQIYHKNLDGSTSLAYFENELEKINPFESDFSLPGWDISYKKSELQQLLFEYKSLGKQRLFENLQYFLTKIIPVAKKCDIKMALHPDDPPWDIFGLPRIVTCEENIDRILGMVDSEYNGIAFCTGSLGAKKSNDTAVLLEKYLKKDRVPFVHLRNIRFENGGFVETAHNQCCGNINIVGIVKLLKKYSFDGFLRPDHGRMIWGEKGKAGYGLFDRALGANYINGVWDTLSSI